VSLVIRQSVIVSYWHSDILSYTFINILFYII